MRRLLVLIPALLALPACDSDDPNDGPDAGDQELITTVEITLTPQGGGTSVRLLATDENGDGIGVAYGDPGLLAAGTTYSGSIRLLDDPNGVAVTEQIAAEADEHLFAYGSSVQGVSVAITDTESDYLEEDQGFEDYAVGLTFDVVVAAGASGTGTLSATLYHFGDEENPKASSTDTSDDTDVELAFPISVE